MIFEQITTGGCQSYLVAYETTGAAVLIDPEMSRTDHYLSLVQQQGVYVRYIVDTHMHADHFTASRGLGNALHAPVVMHQLSPAPYTDLRRDDGDMLIVGNLRLKALHAPGHTRDSMSLRGYSGRAPDPRSAAMAAAQRYRPCCFPVATQPAPFRSRAARLPYR